MLLDSIKANTIRVSTELKEQGGNGIPNAAENPVHYALYVAKYLMLILFMELQEVFDQVISEKITPKFFFQNLLKEEYNEKSLSPGVQYFEHELLQLINNGSSLQEDYLSLLRQYQQAQTNKDGILSKLHNAIYLCEEEPACLKCDNLHDPAFIAAAIDKKKNELFIKINSFAYGHERLNVINMALNAFPELISEGYITNSIPAQLHSWLVGQHDLYLAHANAVFASSVSNVAPQIEANKRTLQESQQIAFEHLRILKGVNHKGEKIMSDEQFHHMIDNVYFLIEKDSLPDKVLPISHTNVSAEFIRYTFYCLHSRLLGTRPIHDSWIHLLHKLFVQFKDAQESTTKKKFAKKPNSYDDDISKMNR